MAEFSLNNIYQDAFGSQPPKPFSIEKATPRKEYSNLGMPYYSEPLDDLFAREFFLPIYINDYLLPFAVLDMTWKKTIISTPMPERGGSVHEMISVDDYEFIVKGLMVDDDGNFPEYGISDLHTLFKINAVVKMRSAVSDIILNGGYNHSVIIKDVKWPVMAAVEHVKPFEISMVSDQIFELELK